MLCVVLCPQVLSRCPIFWHYPVKMSHLSAVPYQDAPSFGRKQVLCTRCLPNIHMTKFTRPSPALVLQLTNARTKAWEYVLKCCQDVPSFGSTLSRCLIFRQEACCVLCYALKYCQDAPSFGRRHVVCCVMPSSTVKMPHLSAGSMLCVVLCPEVLSRCPIFWQYPVKMSHLLAVPCQDVLSHLSAGSMLCVVLCSQVMS